MGIYLNVGVMSLKVNLLIPVCSFISHIVFVARRLFKSSVQFGVRIPFFVWSVSLGTTRCCLFVGVRILWVVLVVFSLIVRGVWCSVKVVKGVCGRY